MLRNIAASLAYWIPNINLEELYLGPKLGVVRFGPCLSSRADKRTKLAAHRLSSRAAAAVSVAVSVASCFFCCLIRAVWTAVGKRMKPLPTLSHSPLPNAFSLEDGGSFGTAFKAKTVTSDLGRRSSRLFCTDPD